MRDWKQKLAIYLLVGSLTLLAFVDKEYRHLIIGMLVPLVIWVIERKDTLGQERQKKEQEQKQGKTESKKKKKK